MMNSIILGIEITVFYLVYFLKQYMMKKRGIQTNKLGRGEKKASTSKLEKKLLLSTYVTGVIQYLSIFRPKWFLLFYFPKWVQTLGILSAGIGVIFFVSAIYFMKNSWRAGIELEEKTEMVTRGIYHFSRNPAFVGFDLIYVGSFLAVPNLILLISVWVSIFLIHKQIKEEEKYLPLLFGEEYITYKEKTPRYLFF